MSQAAEQHAACLSMQGQRAQVVRAARGGLHRPHVGLCGQVLGQRLGAPPRLCAGAGAPRSKMIHIHPTLVVLEYTHAPKLEQEQEQEHRRVFTLELACPFTTQGIVRVSALLFFCEAACTLVLRACVGNPHSSLTCS